MMAVGAVAVAVVAVVNDGAVAVVAVVNDGAFKITTPASSITLHMAILEKWMFREQGSMLHGFFPRRPRQPSNVNVNSAMALRRITISNKRPARPLPRTRC